MAEIEAFLDKANWSKAQRATLAGDAGNRRYERLTDPIQGNAILMDAQPKLGEDIQSFLKIAQHLSECGISAPKIFSRHLTWFVPLVLRPRGCPLMVIACREVHDLDLDVSRQFH